MEPRSNITRDHPQQEHFLHTATASFNPTHTEDDPLFPVDNHTAYQLPFLTKGIQNPRFTSEDWPAIDTTSASSTRLLHHLTLKEGIYQPQEQESSIAHGRCSSPARDTQCTAAEALSTP